MISTQSLVLRRWTLDDAEVLFTYASNPQVGPRAGWPPHKTIDESRHTISTVFSAPETYAITLKNKPIGCIALRLGPTPNIGYWVAASYWGQGIATEAGEAIVSRAFNQYELPGLYAQHFEGNIGSQRVLEKLGFSYVRTMDKHITALDEDRTCLIYYRAR